MKRRLSFLLVSTTAVFLLFLSACDSNEADECDGYFEQLRQLPDTLTLALREEPYELDLEDPPLLRFTGSTSFIYVNVGADNKNVDVYGDGKRGGVLRIQTNRIGSARVTVLASAGCDIYADVSFQVRVVESAQ